MTGDQLSRPGGCTAADSRTVLDMVGGASFPETLAMVVGAVLPEIFDMIVGADFPDILDSMVAGVVLPEILDKVTVTVVDLLEDVPIP